MIKCFGAAYPQKGAKSRRSRGSGGRVCQKSVEFVRFQRTNYARGRLQAFCQKRATPFFDKLSRRSRGSGGRYSLHLAAMGPDGGDVVAVEHIEGPLKALPDRQGPHRLREVPVVHHDGVEGLAHGEDLSPAEVPWCPDSTPPARSGSPRTSRFPCA